VCLLSPSLPPSLPPFLLPLLIGEHLTPSYLRVCFFALLCFLYTQSHLFAPTPQASFGEAPKLILGWALLGRVKALSCKREGAQPSKGFDSHFALVNGFEPCAPGEPVTGDEIVLFESAQVLPRYIVTYEVIKKPKFVPITLLDSSGDECDERSNPLDHAHRREHRVHRRDEGVVEEYFGCMQLDRADNGSAVQFSESGMSLHRFESVSRRWESVSAAVHVQVLRESPSKPLNHLAYEAEVRSGSDLVGDAAPHQVVGGHHHVSACDSVGARGGGSGMVPVPDARVAAQALGSLATERARDRVRLVVRCRGTGRVLLNHWLIQQQSGALTCALHSTKQVLFGAIEQCAGERRSLFSLVAFHSAEDASLCVERVHAVLSLLASRNANP
jgi:hypothetical protein